MRGLLYSDRCYERLLIGLLQTVQMNNFWSDLLHFINVKQSSIIESISLTCNMALISIGPWACSINIQFILLLNKIKQSSRLVWNSTLGLGLDLFYEIVNLKKFTKSTISFEPAQSNQNVSGLL